jgi:colanic acid/amylovoran biosynthesis glycosyltransferase
MLTVAYLANEFPAAVEPYVSEEIHELQLRKVKVIPGTVRRPKSTTHESSDSTTGAETICLQPIRTLTLLRALGMVVRRWRRISSLVTRMLREGNEPPKLRLKALLHTWLGAYYAVLLRDRGVDHIHVHHGYFGSWIGMVAARLLGVGFSLTLHGSDLLIHGVFLDTKLNDCRFCITVSEYNRGYILEHFPGVAPRKIRVSRLGVGTTPLKTFLPAVADETQRRFTLLAVGRLHAVKDHAFLVRACVRLRDCGLSFRCVIAGEGPERQRLEWMTRQNHLQEQIALLGHVPRERMDALYASADVVVLTSRSEGIPLALMEAMALGRIVLAPAITGIPELIVPGKTGFLYLPGKLDDLVQRIVFLHAFLHAFGREEDQPLTNRLSWIRHAARVQVATNFSHDKNLARFGDSFLQLLALRDWSPPYEDLVLQQI